MGVLGAGTIMLKGRYGVGCTLGVGVELKLHGRCQCHIDGTDTAEITSFVCVVYHMRRNGSSEARETNKPVINKKKVVEKEEDIEKGERIHPD